MCMELIVYNHSSLVVIVGYQAKVNEWTITENQNTRKVYWYFLNMNALSKANDFLPDLRRQIHFGNEQVPHGVSFFHGKPISRLYYIFEMRAGQWGQGQRSGVGEGMGGSDSVNGEVPQKRESFAWTIGGAKAWGPTTCPAHYCTMHMSEL